MEVRNLFCDSCKLLLAHSQALTATAQQTRPCFDLFPCRMGLQMDPSSIFWKDYLQSASQSLDLVLDKVRWAVEVFHAFASLSLQRSRGSRSVLWKGEAAELIT